MWGTSIGTRLAPTYANIFVGWLEEKLLRTWTGVLPYLWRRYIDDIIFFWRYSEEELISFLTFLNSCHPTIKFTAEWRTNGNVNLASWCKESKTLKVTTNPLSEGMKNKSVDFLDTTIWIDTNGFIQTDLFVKDCTKVTYLLPSSCHPGRITKNIPYSLAYRLKRIVSVPETFNTRLDQLKDNLLSRNKVIEDAFDRVKLITREDALKKVVRAKQTTCTTDNVIYDLWCKKCKENPSATPGSDQYVGKTGNTASHRFSSHKSDVNNFKTSKAIGEHFNLP